MTPNWAVDDDGVLWYFQRSGGRHRGRWCLCRTCDIRFPSVSNNPGLYCSRRCRAKQYGRHATTRADLFEQLTVEECWLAGLIWADGCLYSDGAGRRVSLALADEEIVRLAADIIGCAYSTYAKRSDRKPAHVIRFGHSAAIERLTQLGLTERKSLTADWPTVPFPASFLRGAFDGDGSVGFYVKGGRRKCPETKPRLLSSLCGSRPFLDGAQDFLAIGGISRRKVNAHGTIHRLQWNHADSLRLRDILYADDGPCLARKRSIFFQ